MKKKQYIWLGIALVLLILIGYLWLGRSMMSVPVVSQTNSATQANIAAQERCVAKSCFSLEIAKTPEERTQGLMFREILAQDHGMVFIFPQSDIYPFWMKNTKIPLDMIRLDASYNIVDIQEANPCTQDPCAVYTPKAKASYVIELNQ